MHKWIMVALAAVCLGFLGLSPSWAQHTHHGQRARTAAPPLPDCPSGYIPSTADPTVLMHLRGRQTVPRIQTTLRNPAGFNIVHVHGQSPRPNLIESAVYLPWVTVSSASVERASAALGSRKSLKLK
jgi:hypothetical protein